MFGHEYFMREALKQAQIAYEREEIPVGAVITFDNRIIAKSHNLTQTLNDVTAHAEMQAFTAAANTLGGKYLRDCTLYVTLEPCIMCGGAAYWTQISTIVYGASDLKNGCTLNSKSVFHPKTKVIKGILEEECGQLLSDFFKKKR